MQLAIEMVPLVMLVAAVVVAVIALRRVSSGRVAGRFGTLFGSKRGTEKARMDSAIRLAKLFEEAEALKAEAGLKQGQPPHPPGLADEELSAPLQADELQGPSSDAASAPGTIVEPGSRLQPEMNGDQPAVRREDHLG